MDVRPKYLGWVETALRTENPDLPELHISAQSHYDPIFGLAFIEVHGVRHDRSRRRQLRSEAGKLLGRLGCNVLLEPGRDVYIVKTQRPTTAHERMQMLRELRAVLAERGTMPK